MKINSLVLWRFSKEATPIAASEVQNIYMDSTNYIVFDHMENGIFRLFVYHSPVMTWGNFLEDIPKVSKMWDT